MDEYITCIRKDDNKRDTYLIYINDSLFCRLNKKEIEKCDLKENIILNEEDKRKLSDVLYEKALNKALIMIKGREYTSFETESKLKNAGFSEDICRKVIEDLKAKRYIDDRRYMETYISYYSEMKSKAVIINNLLKKGLNKDEVENAYEDFIKDTPDIEKKLCKDLLLSHFHDIEKTSELSDEELYKYKIKIKRYLAGKGFSFSVIDDVMSDFL